ncbi:MAG: DUF2497 domain-containing protein, partial [Kiloniellaceae bacterium]
MSDTKSHAEPTMEEILASIRRIISEDDPALEQEETEEAVADHAPVEEPVTEDQPAREGEGAQEDDVPELTRPEDDVEDDVLEL